MSQEKDKKLFITGGSPPESRFLPTETAFSALHIALLARATNGHTFPEIGGLNDQMEPGGVF
jgi:hypothetical protein